MKLINDFFYSKKYTVQCLECCLSYNFLKSINDESIENNNNFTKCTNCKSSNIIIESNIVCNKIPDLPNCIINFTLNNCFGKRNAQFKNIKIYTNLEEQNHT